MELVLSLMSKVIKVVKEDKSKVLYEKLFFILHSNEVFKLILPLICAIQNPENLLPQITKVLELNASHEDGIEVLKPYIDKVSLILPHF